MFIFEIKPKLDNKFSSRAGVLKIYFWDKKAAAFAKN
jgi:hypothetical protein